MSFDKDRVLDEIDKVELVASEGRGPVGWVYFIACTDSGRCKIGFTKGDPLKRLANLQTGSASEMSLIAMHPGPVESERALHEKFAADRLHGEWFRMSDSLRAYLVVTVWTMSELTIRAGHPLKPWMSLGLELSLEHLETISESLAELLEGLPE